MVALMLLIPPSQIKSSSQFTYLKKTKTPKKGFVVKMFVVYYYLFHLDGSLNVFASLNPKSFTLSVAVSII